MVIMLLLGKHTIATTNYTLPYSAALQKNNFYGVQFHPEKSAVAGEQILKNFLQIGRQPDSLVNNPANNGAADLTSKNDKDIS